MKRHAFTLIELLVVVAIIVALLAILLPSMNKALDAAMRAVCLSNVHQLTNGALAYATDYQGRYPDRAKDHGGPHIWHDTTGFAAGVTSDDRDMLTDYFGSGSGSADEPNPIFFCPNANSYDVPCNQTNGWPISNIWYTSSYYYFGAWNNVYGYSWVGSVPSPTSVATAHASTPLFADLVEDNTQAFGLWWNLNHARDGSAVAGVPGQTEYAGGMSSGYVDGSGRWTDFEADVTAEVVITKNDLKPGHWWAIPR